MSDDLLQHGSPFGARYHEACRMGRHAMRGTSSNKEVLIYGLRGAVKHPLMSVLVQREFGNARHALAQRVVAGTMTVHIAPAQGAPRLKPDSKDSSSSPSNQSTAPESPPGSEQPTQA